MLKLLNIFSEETIMAKINRKLSSPKAPKMVSTSAPRKNAAAPAKAPTAAEKKAAAAAATERRNKRDPADKKFDSDRAKHLAGQKAAGNRKAGATTAKDQLAARIKAYNEKIAAFETTAKLREQVHAKNVAIAEGNRKKLSKYSGQVLSAKLMARRKALKAAKPHLNKETGKVIVPKVGPVTAKVPGKPKLTPQVTIKNGKIVNRAKRAPVVKATVGADAGNKAAGKKAGKTAKRAHNAKA